MAVNNLVKRLQNIMRQDAGVNGDAQRIEQMVWLIFLKVYDTQEMDWMLDDPNYKSIIPEPLQWHNWAPSKDDEGHAVQSITGNELLQFIDNTLFPVLKGQDSVDGTIKGIRVNKETPRGKAVVQEVFMEVNNYMKNGVLLRQMIDVIDEVDLTDPEDSHTFADIYEQILKDLQGAGRAGEFYTPRALTDLIIYLLHPKIGEIIGDWAMGTGGFLTSGLKYLDKQCKTAEDREMYQSSVEGQEWKPFPYLLAVTNLLLHGIKNPKLFHMDSLGVPMTDYNHEGKVDVIAMNPPYGGATDATTKMNFKTEFRSSETADLFMVLIMQRLKKHGRAGVILPDGFLFGTDGPKLAIKKKLLTDFNLHTIIRLPGSIFSPYTSIATNILFFNNERAEDAPEETATKDVWFYRMDIPEGYKHFSKSKPMLFEHTKKIREWWNDRHEIVNGENDIKSKKFSAQELLDLDCNFDQCKFPKEEDEVLRPEELLKKYHDERAKLDETIDRTLNEIETMLGLEVKA